MNIANDIKREISDFIGILVANSLCDDQNMPSIKRSEISGTTDITVSGASSYTAAMKNIDYCDAFKEIERTESYNLKMIDGALIQLLYRISLDNVLISHRLAFFSSPTHATYQNEQEIYELDPIYADFLKKNIVPFPIRFDYNMDDDIHVDCAHPKSHVTLGQYEACRIPVSSPIGPGVFIKFIMRNFYNSAFSIYPKIQATPCISFDPTITQLEEQLTHLKVECSI